MARYFIQATHTKDECVKTMDEIAAQGWDAIARYDFGCAAGDGSNHVAYAFVEAANEAGARDALPTIMQPKATITPVAKVSADELLSLHR